MLSEKEGKKLRQIKEHKGSVEVGCHQTVKTLY